jgi:protein-tyrosine phosphatase
MIDLHNHLLPGLDDGAQTREESMEMCRISLHDGVTTIVATPHTLNGVYENDRLTILAKVQELNALISKKLGSPDPVPEFLQESPNQASLKILPGADIHFSEKVLAQLDRGKAMTIGDGGKFLLLEFPFHGIPYGAEVVLFELLARGLTPIITHPERNLEIARKPQRYGDMVFRGCLGQVSAMSLTGGFGKSAKQIAETLLKKRLVHFIASDAHSPDGRSPVISSAVQAAARIVGKEEARRMVTEYPQAVLEGRRPDFSNPNGRS